MGREIPNWNLIGFDAMRKLKAMSTRDFTKYIANTELRGISASTVLRIYPIIKQSQIDSLNNTEFAGPSCMRSWTLFVPADRLGSDVWQACQFGTWSRQLREHLPSGRYLALEKRRSVPLRRLPFPLGEAHDSRCSPSQTLMRLRTTKNLCGIAARG